MAKPVTNPILLGILLIACALMPVPGEAESASISQEQQFQAAVAPFLAEHCVKCHGPDKQKGDVRLDNLPAARGSHLEQWISVADQLRDGLMPPKKEPRPDDAKVRIVLAWIARQSGDRVGRLPNQGNFIPNEALFGSPVDSHRAPEGRVWRLSPEGYMGWVRDLVRGKPEGIVQPFTLIPERGIKDFPGLYSIDEQTTAILLRNSEAIVDLQMGVDKDRKGGKSSVREFIPLLDPATVPTHVQLAAAVQAQFRVALGRPATADHVERLIGLYDKCAKDGDRAGAARTMLQAVLLRADAMFRIELGNGTPDGSGRRMLAPEELARALSLALCDRRDPVLADTANKGQLSSREQVVAQVRRMLDDPKLEKPRILRFFRQYFEYGKATDLFKERSGDRIKHVPDVLVADTDLLILYIIGQDKDVLGQLLTTPLSYVNAKMQTDRKTRIEALVQADIIPPPPSKKREPEWIGGVEAVYGLEQWSATQPMKLTPETRLGILMQPSWLVAWSTNFDNDPVRRGRWIRERLLGGTVPDLPIGLAAQVPDEKDRTFRDRLTVTHADQCWKCHRRMDDLGLAFENFDHYGRFRTTEKVVDLSATSRNVTKKGNFADLALRDAPLDTTGLIADSGDATLDGPVKDPRELVTRLAASARVRQVFVRHVFRYFMGRNECLSDARTLQEADRAYVDSGGSFKALIVSLLSSDAFLYRSSPSSPPTAAGVLPDGVRP